MAFKLGADLEQLTAVERMPIASALPTAVSVQPGGASEHRRTLILTSTYATRKSSPML